MTREERERRRYTTRMLAAVRTYHNGAPDEEIWKYYHDLLIKRGEELRAAREQKEDKPTEKPTEKP